MPYFGDFVGQIVSELAAARMLADQESARLAELYRTDPHLRHFSVPRFRAPEITLRFPVAVAELETTEDPRPLDTGRMGAVVTALIDGELAQFGYSLGREGRRRLTRAVRGQVDLIDAGAELPSVREAAERFTDVVTSEVGDARRREDREDDAGEFEIALRTRLESALLRLRRPAPRLNVLVTAPEVRDDSGTVHVEISLREEGVEWVRVDGPSGTAERLLPE